MNVRTSLISHNVTENHTNDGANDVLRTQNQSRLQYRQQALFSSRFLENMLQKTYYYY